MERTKPSVGSTSKKIDSIDDEALAFLNENDLKPISSWDGKGKVVNVRPAQPAKMQRTTPSIGATPGHTNEPIVAKPNTSSNIPEEYILAALDLNKELGITPPILIKGTTIDEIKKQLIKASASLDLDDDDVAISTLQTLKTIGCKINPPIVPIPSTQKKLIQLQKVEKLVKEQKENQMNLMEFPHLFLKRLYGNWSLCLEEWERAKIIDDMIYGLAGDSSKRERQEILTALTGENVPASKAGIVILKMMIIKWLDELQNSRFDAFKEKQKPKFTRTIPATAAPVQVSKFTRTR